MAVTKDEIIEALKEMPALELADLVHELEDVFGVSAAAPVAVAAAPAAGEAAAEAKDLVENVPSTILEGAKTDDANAAKEKLEAAGAAVTLK